MAVFKLINLLAISSLAILASSLNAIPAANALTVHEAHSARTWGDAHHRVAKRASESKGRKRDLSKRCTPRPSSSIAAAHAAATSAVASSSTSAPKEIKSSTAAAQKESTTQAASSTHKAAAPTETSSAKAVATSAAASTGSSSNSGAGSASGCKVGLAWSNHEADLIPKFKTDKVCWIYDWEESLQYGMTTDGMNYIPMLWGSKNAGAFGSKVVKGYASYAAGMNEPDIPSQANLSPADGVKLWNQYFCGLKSQGYTLLSPATATGPQWLQEFQKAGACDWDITAVHVYTTTVDSFKSAVSAYQTFNKPVMVTEYSCNDYSGQNQQCSSDQIWSFLQGVNGWMDGEDWIVGYFFFAPMTASELEANNINGANALITSDGNGLTALGKFYIGA